MDRRCPRTGGWVCEEWGSGEVIQNSGSKTHINVQQSKVYTRKKKSPEDVCNGREAARQKGGGQTRSAAQDSRKRREQIAEQWEKCKKEDDEGGCSGEFGAKKRQPTVVKTKKKGKRGRQRTEHSADKTRPASELGSQRLSGRKDGENGDDGADNGRAVGTGGSWTLSLEKSWRPGQALGMYIRTVQSPVYTYLGTYLHTPYW